MHETYKKWLENGQPKIFCECVDREEIIITILHKYNGIPKYIHNHHCKGKPCSVERKLKIGNGNRGKKRSDENIKILSESHMNLKHSENRKEKISNSLMGNKNSKGYKHTKEQRIRNSESHKGILCGENNPNWKGGTSFLPYCEKFNEKKKEEVREQYNRKCYLCGKDEKENITKINKMRKLSVHHIDSDKEQGCNDKPWKLLPLCMHCHNRRKDLINLRVNI